MLRNEYEALTGMGNLSDCNVPDSADKASVWAIRRELRIERLARDWATGRPSASLAA
jgi:hypothetical protein